jgi:hypothetical protein
MQTQIPPISSTTAVVMKPLDSTTGLHFKVSEISVS